MDTQWHRLVRSWWRNECQNTDAVVRWKQIRLRTSLLSQRTDLQTVMRFFLSTATFRTDAFFETSPMAIAACTQPDTIQEEAAPLQSKDPSLSDTGPLHALLGDASEDGFQHGDVRAGSSLFYVWMWRKKGHIKHTVGQIVQTTVLSLFLSLSLSAYFLSHRDVTSGANGASSEDKTISFYFLFENNILNRV